MLGSGGSILTVPILHYLVGQAEKVAIAGSLFVVGAIALVGGVQSALHRSVEWRSVLFFGVPGMAGTYLGAWASIWVPGGIQLLLFVLVMYAAGFFMLRPNSGAGAPASAQGPRVWKIGADGLAVGVLTGLVGVGGGFLIVPALVLLGGLDMRRAIGTSLVIIALKSFSGFYKYLDVLDHMGLALDWPVLGIFVLVGTIGSLVGGRISQRLDHRVLQRMFAILLIVMGTAIAGALASEAIAT